MEAFDLAVQNFKEKGDQTERASSSRVSAVIQLPDQRFTVIAALAKRDPARARKLSEQMLQDDARDVAGKSAPEDQSKRLTADKLLRMAFDLAPTDPSAAINFARQSFRYPATLQLPVFFYQLARFNQPLADQFYADALNAYGAALLNWFYYFRTQELIKNKNLAEARKFASKVNELDQRAYLFTRIAEESLKVDEDQTEAREMLNEVANTISKAPKTIVSARALLALALRHNQSAENAKTIATKRHKKHKIFL